MRELFRKEEPEWITTKPATQADWSPCLQTLESHRGAGNARTFTKEDKHHESAARNKTVKTTETASSKCLQTLEGHSDWVRSVTFSHDNKHLASASHDETVKIWNTASS